MTSSIFQVSNGISSGRPIRKSPGVWQTPETASSTLRTPESGPRDLEIRNALLPVWAGGYGPSVRRAREVAKNIFVYSPLVLPPFGSAWQRFLNRRAFLRQLKRIIGAMGIKDPVLWTYLPTDTAIDIIRSHRTDRSVVVYYNCADFSYLTPKAKWLEKSEQELVRLSDLVFATCSAQAHKPRPTTERTSFHPVLICQHFPRRPSSRPMISLVH